MDNVTVLVTGAGAPGIAGTLYSLRNNFDGRKIKIIGTDILDITVGGYLCDKTYKVSTPSRELLYNKYPQFILDIIGICEKEKVDVILPQVTAELEDLSVWIPALEEIGTTVAVSPTHTISETNNKHRLLCTCKQIGIPVPEFHLVHTWEQFETALDALCYPEKKIVIKPPISSGSRGFRIIDENLDRVEAFYRKKPTGIHIRKNELDFLGEVFPPLLVMEYLPNMEYTVDVLARGENQPTVVPRRRDNIRTGITFRGTVEKDADIIEYSERLTEEVGLDYAFGFQFKRDSEGIAKIIECNPRIQGTMVLSTLAGANIVYGAVKKALEEDIPEFKIKWGTELLRYWGGIGVLDGTSFAEI